MHRSQPDIVIRDRNYITVFKLTCPCERNAFKTDRKNMDTVRVIKNCK